MLDDAIERALTVCLNAHQGQYRRGDAERPYSVHPLHMALVLERVGAGPVVVQAALLHDVVEDCEGWTQARIEAQFGVQVASIVAELTEDKSQTWDQRKRAGVDRVAELSPEALMVKAADKLHNLWSLAEQLSRAAEPGVVWQLFRGGRARTLSMARELVEALASRVPESLAMELHEALSRVELLG